MARRLRLISILNGKVGYNGKFPQTALFLGSIIDLYCLVLILRVWLLSERGLLQPISILTLKLTQPVIAPLRKVFPVVKKSGNYCTGFSLLALRIEIGSVWRVKSQLLPTIGHIRAD